MSLRPQTFVKRPVKIQAMEIVRGSLEEQFAAFNWVKSHIGTFSIEAILLGTAEIPMQGIAIDNANGQFVLAHKGQLKLGNDGDWIIRKPNGEFNFCPPNLFKTQYQKVDPTRERT